MKLQKKTKYDGYYITKTGLLLSVKKKGGQGSFDFNNPRIHSTKIDRYGYLTCCISYVDNGIQKRIYPPIHKLIWETYIGLVSPDKTIDHIDNNKLNNCLDNYQLLSVSENTRKAKKGKPNPNRYFYELYKDKVFLGIYDKTTMEQIIGCHIPHENLKRRPKKGRIKIAIDNGYNWKRIRV